MAALDPLPPSLQLFHQRCWARVHLASLCAHSQEVATDAELLHLGLPGLAPARLAALPPADSLFGMDEEEGEAESLYGLEICSWLPDSEMQVHLVRGERATCCPVFPLGLASSVTQVAWSACRPEAARMWQQRWTP